jgi:XTP/dITP diphosphohydrolase
MRQKKALIIATKNKGKVLEIKHVLKPLKLNILSLLDMPNVPDIKESGRTFEANAIKKAVSISKISSALVLADDSGLCVDALNGKPGIRSDRYAGPNPTTQKLCEKLLKEMKSKKNRKAKFICVMAVADGKKVRIAKGICEGAIAHEMNGTHGFGYDPVFVPMRYSKTFAQMPLKLKNNLSHRGKALRKVADILAKMI